MMLLQSQHEGSAEAARLRAVRARHAAVLSADWRRAHDGVSDMLEVRAEMGERHRILRFDDAADTAEMDFLAESHGDVGFLLELVDRAATTVLALRRDQDRQAQDRQGEGGARQGSAGPVADERKNYAAEAAMKCGESGFKVFLEQCHGLERPLTDERTAQKLRSLLGVTSRRELNSNDAAAARWKKLRRVYETWRRAQQ